MARNYLPDLFGWSSATDLFASLQKEIDQVFRNFGPGLPVARDGRDGIAPVKFNIAETANALEVTAEIAGVDPKDIDVKLRDGILTVRGEKKAETEEKDKSYHLVERSYGMFERSFQLPFDVESDKVAASFDKGVLKVSLPKAPAARQGVKKIEVKSAA